ncbi:hypothetical protein TGDOM2_400440 [Toxoplasma gondii GAB2-2007-GAL-DOM2]|uniref:Uncharacterized protein n=1 Tax=Toxoplasma gondii GAB2-2007-GAL-DOM2 TaxID=1130820 RepID=A0A086JRL9_TOXGO|nr:hypothetical protein TGDOM2_400440 [Toxoplasma gondii GAB2-2007-GAL-DOM2]
MNSSVEQRASAYAFEEQARRAAVQTNSNASAEQQNRLQQERETLLLNDRRKEEQWRATVAASEAAAADARMHAEAVSREAKHLEEILRQRENMIGNLQKLLQQSKSDLSRPPISLLTTLERTLARITPVFCPSFSLFLPLDELSNFAHGENRFLSCIGAAFLLFCGQSRPRMPASAEEARRRLRQRVLRLLSPSRERKLFVNEKAKEKSEERFFCVREDLRIPGKTAVSESECTTTSEIALQRKWGTYAQASIETGFSKQKIKREEAASNYDVSRVTGVSWKRRTCKDTLRPPKKNSAPHPHPRRFKSQGEGKVQPGAASLETLRELRKRGGERKPQTITFHSHRDMTGTQTEREARIQMEETTEKDGQQLGRIDGEDRSEGEESLLSASSHLVQLNESRREIFGRSKDTERQTFAHNEHWGNSFTRKTNAPATPDRPPPRVH